MPPPLGLLGADSLGLEEDVDDGESARFGADPPPVANWVGNGSDIGESAGSAGSGAAGSAGPATAGVEPLRAGAAAAPALAAVVAAGLATALLLAGIPGDASETPGADAVTPAADAAAGAASTALARALLPASAVGSVAGPAGIGVVALAPAGRLRECPPELCEPPRASALAAKQISNRATAGKRYKGGLSVSILTP